jgi:class 3 adenylate cyclase/tetratricopeptide (TPR) repeat protein
MKCPSCQSENPEGAKFCNGCGNPLPLVCPKCGKLNPPGSQFCNACGSPLAGKVDIEKARPIIEAERKQVTVLFADLSGYTAMTEKLDPEEVKEITSRIFGEIAQVVAQYEGCIHRLIGDQAMVLFGVPQVHEDDPFRATRAAREIHDRVDALSPQFEEKIGRPLAMHTGINTGLVVTGELDLAKGLYGEITGDTINLASRLSDLARAGEIIVGPETYRRTQGAFTFQTLGPTQVEGKAGSIQVYRVVSAKGRLTPTHRLSGLRADLIGRRAELAQLEDAIQRLREGKGTIISICGEAGTGKSRLVAEFRTTLDLNQIQWLEGHAYAYSQNIPYFPLIDLLNRAWQIEEGDPPEKVREKVESGIELLMGKTEEVAPYIGGLYALSYPEAVGVSPELWKSRLLEAVQAILSTLTRKGPTVLCLEDLQWADPSSLDLLRFLLSEFKYPALFLCVYRLPFSLLASDQWSGIGKRHREIRLQDLSSSDALDMMESLLQSKSIPLELRRFVQENVEGNPFYLEEVMNSLIESGTLARNNGTWRLTRPLGEADIPPTVQGVISARIDRLEKEMKRILQEAAVIGRAFLYEILRKITELKESIDRYLHGLEQLDLIRTRSVQPELEYVFKHALTQEVVYRGLVKKERQAVHERIAQVMEQLFHDRLSEIYETLAFHFKHGQSVHKAVDYLVKSGEKSLRKYSVEESHRSFQEAYDLLAEQPARTPAEDKLFIDLLNKWSFVFHYRGDFGGLTELLSRHQPLAVASGDRVRLGTYYTRLGLALYETEKVQDAYRYLQEALALGEETEDQGVIGYACSWLAWACGDLGLFQEAIRFGERAGEIGANLTSEEYLFFNTLGGLGLAYCFSGDVRKAFESGQALLKQGQRYENIRSQTMGHFVVGCSHMAAGDLASARESLERASRVSMDPWYSQFPRLLQGQCLILMGEFQKAKEPLMQVLEHSQLFGTGVIGTPARQLLAIIAITEGRLAEGLKTLEGIQRGYLSSKRRYAHAAIEHIIGKIYFQFSTASRAKFPVMRNLGFLLRNLPFARRKAEEHLKRSIAAAEEIGARCVAGMAYLDLGLLYQTMGKGEQSRECLMRARQLFEQCGAEFFLKQVDAALKSVG